MSTLNFEQTVQEIIFAQEETLIPQVTASEIIAGNETNIRLFSVQDMHDFVDQHSPAAGGGDAWSDPVDAHIVPDGYGTMNFVSAVAMIGECHVVELHMQNGTVLKDSNGNALLGVTGTASAVNSLLVENNVAGGGPLIKSTGETNAPLRIGANGSGNVEIISPQLWQADVDADSQTLSQVILSSAQLANALDASNQKVTNLANGTSPGDAVNKGQLVYARQ